MSNPTAAILIIGNEILSGRTQDVNVNFIAKRLADLGIKLQEVRVIPDVPGRIISAVNELRASYDLLFTTGGIGPTHDEERFNAARQRMATMPRGAVPIKNEVSLAPGFSIGNVHVMAGVPRIMQAMFAALEPSLPRGEAIEMRAVYGLGVMEGSIAAGLSAIQDRYPAADLGSYPFQKEAGGGVAIVAKGTDIAALEAAITEVTALIAGEGVTPVQGEP
jgi:molybdopterin-biosynthesis enzyme MoeA-like protein